MAGESVLRYWADSFFLKDLIPLEKRLFDWWISEGFFCVSNFKNGEKEINVELMLLLGGSIYQVLGHKKGSEVAQTEKIISKKIQSGWSLLKSECEGYYLVEDTKSNRIRIRRLLDVNIRNFDIVDFTSRQVGKKAYLKSVTVDIHRKREANDETIDTVDRGVSDESDREIKGRNI